MVEFKNPIFSLVYKSAGINKIGNLTNIESIVQTSKRKASLQKILRSKYNEYIHQNGKESCERAKDFSWIKLGENNNYKIEENVISSESLENK